jgi:SAM-dependent methyltransferase
MMKKTLSEIYHPTYHDIKNAGSIAAARTILPLVFDIFEIDSVLDVGCGAGTWLAAARGLGASSLTGIEGEWAGEWPKQEILPLSDFELVTQNLEDRFDLGRTYDLTICVEVAEHLTQLRAESLVNDLCSSSKRVLFAAAIPLQGGNNHLNEQWPSFWAKLFQDRGYIAMDFIRGRIWRDTSLPYWYRQNTILFVSDDQRDVTRTAVSLPAVVNLEALDLVHPELYREKTNKANDWPFISSFGRALRRLFQRISRMTGIGTLLGRRP